MSGKLYNFITDDEGLKPLSEEDYSRISNNIQEYISILEEN